MKATSPPTGFINMPKLTPENPVNARQVSYRKLLDIAKNAT